MEILIVFETVEGQTRKIVDIMAARARAAGHGVHLFDAADRLATLSVVGIDKIILAAPVHERRHPPSFEVLVGASLKELASCPTFFVSVSLKAAFREGQEEARDYLTEMKMRTGFEPDVEILAAGAVRTDSYGYFESQIVKNVVLDGRDISLMDGVREFTAWDKLGTSVDEFLAS